MRFSLIRNEEGWHLFSHEFTFESLLQTFPTRRAALTDLQTMKLGEQMAHLMPMDNDDE